MFNFDTNLILMYNEHYGLARVINNIQKKYNRF